MKKILLIFLFILATALACSSLSDATGDLAATETAVAAKVMTQLAPVQTSNPVGSESEPSQLSSFNPFENITADQEACLKQAWGDETFQAITSFQRPPALDEVKAMSDCGLTLPPPPNGTAQPGGIGAPALGPTLSSRAPLDITSPYLMSFHACDTAAAECRDPRNHQVYLAQSDDGAQWSIIPGWTPYAGSVPDVIRRGNTLYLYTPNQLVRYHLDTGIFEGPMEVTVNSGEMFVDPSAFVDEQGRLALFFLYGQVGGDPAGCLPQETTCEKRFGSATEVEGSDGASFTVDEGDRATITLSTSGGIRSASDPDIFFDGTQYILYISHGPSTSVWTSPPNGLRGAYTQVSTLPDGMLSNGTGGVAAGYFDPITQQYWTFAHAGKQNQATAIRRATHTDFSRQLSESDWNVTISGASLGLTQTSNVESAGFAVNEP